MSMHNHLPCITLCQKEVKRFLKVYNQTVIAPVVNAVLFLTIFSLAIDTREMRVGNLSFMQFMVPGLIMMSVIQNAFLNTASTITMGKVVGPIIDYIMPPFSPSALIFALVFGGVARGIAVGVVAAFTMSLISPMGIHDFGILIFYAIVPSTIMALLGILTGIVSNSFDQMSAVTSYIVTPLSFLSGTFYSTDRLPPILYKISHLNPFFYMIDGFRYAITGYHDSPIIWGIIYLSCLLIMLWMLLVRLIKIGWRIKD